MAGVTSGSVSTGKYDGRYYTGSWTATQNINTNETTVKWTIKAVGGNSNWYAERTLSLKVTSDNTLSGTTSYSKSARVERYTGTVKTGTFTIKHDANGDASFKMVLKAAVYTSTVNCTGSKTFELTNIPRKSTLTVAAGTLNTEQTLTVARKSTSFTHSIVATCGSQSKTICSKSTVLSFKFIPPIEWASENTAGKTVSVKYTITTYNGSTSIGSNVYTVNCTIPSNLASPTLDVAVTDTTGAFAKYGKYVQGRSILQIVATAKGLYGATIKSYKTTVDGDTYTSATATTPTIKGSGTLNLSCVITDSRGYTNTVNKTLTVLEYTAPKLTALTTKRCNEDGTSNNSGDYLQVTFSGAVTALENKNTVRVTVQYKKTTDANYESKEVPAYNDIYTITNGTYIFAADKKSTYDITLIIEDSFGYVDRYTTGASEKVLWSRLWRGLGLAIGKVAELEGVFEVGFLTKLTGGLINPVIPNGTDLNEVTTPNVYASNARNAANLKNCPVPDGNSFTLEVMSAGHVGQILQRITTCNKTNPSIYERHYYDGAWGEWVDKINELNNRVYPVLESYAFGSRTFSENSTRQTITLDFPESLTSKYSVIIPITCEVANGYYQAVISSCNATAFTIIIHTVATSAFSSINACNVRFLCWK